MLYERDEKVLCFHGPLIYQAKILLAEDWKGDDNHNGAVGQHYLVHYQGWKKTWDEWVPETRLLKYNEENLARQKALVDAQKAEAKVAAQAAESSGANTGTSGKRDQRKSAGSSSAGRGTKRSREATDQDDSDRRPDLKVGIPDALKVQLVDDWENVTRKEQLVPLPRKPNVREILQQYAREYRARHKNKKDVSSAVLDEVIAGLKLYFDKSLPQNLLYRLERRQYVEMRQRQGAKTTATSPANSEEASTKTRNPAKTTNTTSADPNSAPSNPTSFEMEASEIYGAEHLLRLFVNLPSIVAHSNMDAESIALLREHITGFLAFLTQERQRLFVSSYETPSVAYLRQGGL
ncbi:Esa1p-associated factor [Malassezia yamatoensis]|uniref:Chromatin modification-related protein EAF3 n=1 Tax=Malassezia yamatoensis TaxID=253288 RepID=A0AAJ5YSJ6_9BASI|nr:Esa1p-associated factor [Malassezia yamatoensis]